MSSSIDTKVVVQLVPVNLPKYRTGQANKPSSTEITTHYRPCVSVVAATELKVTPEEDKLEVVGPQALVWTTDDEKQHHSYVDETCDMKASTQAIYTSYVSELVRHCIAGQDATMFVCGQRNCDIPFLVHGCDNSLSTLAFTELQAAAAATGASITMTAVVLHWNKVFDLMQDWNSPALKRKHGRVPTFVDVTQVQMTELAQGLSALQSVMKNRNRRYTLTGGPALTTIMNFTLQLPKANTDAAPTKSVFKLVGIVRSGMVQLTRDPKATIPGPMTVNYTYCPESKGDQLFRRVLAAVAKAATAPPSKFTHIPWRDCLMTQLLQDSLCTKRSSSVNVRWFFRVMQVSLQLKPTIEVLSIIDSVRKIAHQKVM
jgi:hypothetical protein